MVEEVCAELSLKTQSLATSVAQSHLTPSTSVDATVYGIQSLLDDSSHEDPAAAFVTTTNPDYACSRMLHQEEYTDSKGLYEGWLLWHDAHPRQAMVPARGSPAKRTVEGVAKEEKDVLDMMLIDLTGPIAATLWGEHATSFINMKETAMKSNAQSKVIVKLHGFRIGSMTKNDWNGNVLSNIKILHSKEKNGTSASTVLSVSIAPSSPYLIAASFEIPNAPACISMFAPLRNKLSAAPFRGTFAGIVVDVQLPSESQSGSPKRHFDLIDKAGTWISCCAMGQHAMSKALSAGNEVVLYFCTARSQIGDAKASLYLFKDAVVVMVKKAATVPEKRLSIEIA
jgi:hypothetical protein